MRALPLLLVLALVGAFALRGGPARGGEGAAGGKVTVVSESAIALATVVRAEFRGESVGQALALVENALGGKVQFFVSPAVRDVPMPHLKVTETPLHGLLSLSMQLVRDLRLRVRVGSSYEDVTGLHDNADLLPERFPNPKESLIVLAELSEEEFDTGQSIERRLRVYRVGDLLTPANVTVDDLATAIETAWQAEGTRHHATLKFHKETGLLICSGTPDHLLLVEQVLEGVSKQPLAASVAVRLDELAAKTAALEQAQAKAAESHKGVSQLLQGFEARIAALEAAARKAAAAREK